MWTIDFELQLTLYDIVYTLDLFLRGCSKVNTSIRVNIY